MVWASHECCYRVPAFYRLPNICILISSLCLLTYLPHLDVNTVGKAACRVRHTLKTGPFTWAEPTSLGATVQGRWLLAQLWSHFVTPGSITHDIYHIVCLWSQIVPNYLYSACKAEVWVCGVPSHPFQWPLPPLWPESSPLGNKMKSTKMPMPIPNHNSVPQGFTSPLWQAPDGMKTK